MNLPAIPKLSSNVGYRKIAADIKECADQEAVAHSRKLEIEARLIKPAEPLDPHAVLAGAAPSDAEELRREHTALSSKIGRLRNAAAEFNKQLAALGAKLAETVSQPVAQAHAENAAEILAAWRVLKALGDRERELLAVLEDAGYPSAGLQPTMPVHVDFDTIIRQAERDAAAIARRAKNLADEARGAA
jgi:hypothetical protein